MSRRLLLTVFLVAAVCVSGAPAAAASSADPIAYELKFERPNTHLLDVTIHADSLSGASVDFAMPDWAPGSYYIENYAANVQRFRAHTLAGQELSWRKTDSQTWRIELAGAKAVTVEYQVFANTLQNNIASNTYSALNLHSSYQVTKNFQLFALIENGSNATYYTFGMFSPTSSVPIVQAPGSSNPRSYSPAAPIAATVGIRATF